jgi:hypothetical protein
MRNNIEMSPEVNSRDKRVSRYAQNNQKEDDNLSKYSDEKRSTLPLHSDSFNKHSDRKRNRSIDNAENKEIIDTEKRNPYKTSIGQSPHFMDINHLSNSNPFKPCDSKYKSLDYEDSPRDVDINLDNLRSALTTLSSKLSPQDLTDFLSEFLPKPPKRHVGIQNEIVKSDSRKVNKLEQEIEDLRTELSLCKSANAMLKQKYESVSERSTTLEKLLRERETKIYTMRLENDGVATELRNARLMEEHMKSEIEGLKSKRDEIEDRLKEMRLIRGQEVIQVR